MSGFGVGSRLYDQENAAFLASRDQYFLDAMKQIGQMQGVLTGQPASYGQAPLRTQPTVQQQLPAAQMPDNDLIGAAKFWGLPEQAAASMPREALARWLESNRSAARPEEVGFAQRIAGSVAEFGVGAVQGIVGLAANTPLVSDSLKRTLHVQDAQQWLAGLDEGVRANERASDSLNYDLAKGAGAIAGTWYPAMGAWKLAGAAGRIGLVASAGKFIGPIGRGIAQGAATGWLMEGAGPHALQAEAGGAVLGGLGGAAPQLLARYAPSIARASQRVARAFGGPQDDAAALAVGPVPTAGPSPQGPWPSGPQMGPIEMQTTWTRIGALRDQLSEPTLSPEARQNLQAAHDYLQGQVTQPSGTSAAMGNQIDPLPQGPSVPPPGGPAGPGSSFTPLTGPFTPEPVGLYAPAKVEGAIGAAAQMNKQSLVMESPALAEIAGSTEIGEGAAVKAAVASNPGGTSVVEGVTDPAKIAQQLVLDAGGPYRAVDIRFARNPAYKGLDVLIGTDHPITDQMVAEYEQHGMYSGQDVMTPSGVTGKLLGIKDGYGIVRPAYSKGPPLRTKLDRLSPQNLTQQPTEVPGLYDAFQAFAHQQEAEISQAMGGAVQPSGWLEPRMSQRLPQFMSDFFDAAGIQGEGQRARLGAYFNERRVEDFQRLAAEPVVLSQQIASRAAETEVVPQSLGRALDETAATKGFVWVPTANKAGGVLREMNVGTLRAAGAPMELSFGSEEAALAFVRKLNRDLPDITPASDVPVEVANQHPTSQHTDPKLPNELAGGDLVEGGVAAAEHYEDLGRVQGPWPSGFQQGPGASMMGGQIRGQLEQLRASNNWGGLMDSINGLKQRWMQPMRARFLGLETQLQQAGLSLARPFEHYDRISTGMDQAHNWAKPWHDDWSRIMQTLSARHMHSGDWTRAYEMLDPAEQLAFAKSKGFSQGDIDAFAKVDDFFSRIFPESGIEAARQIKQYIPHVRALQAGGAGDRAYSPFAQLSPYVDFFAEHVREGGVQFRELDPRLLGAHYVRALGFNRFVSQAWEDGVGTWNEVAKDETLKPVADIFTSWAKVVRRGYQVGDDKALDVIHAAFNAFMPMTRGEAAQLVNLGLTNSHRALLGFRPDVILRDSIQPLMAAPRMGRQLFETIREYTQGTDEVKRAIWERGLKHGWVQVAMPRIEMPGVGEMLPAGVSEAEAARLGQSTRRQIVTKIGETLHDFLPNYLKDITGSPADPLYLFSKLGERNRLIVGEAAFQKASKALEVFRGTSGAPGEEWLLAESKAATFDPPVQRRFMDFVRAGQDEQAAAFLGRQLADVTQFRYGVREGPEVARSLSGRIGFQMGNFTTQYWQYMLESLRNGSVSDKAQFLGWMGAVAGSLKLAKAATGWDFDKWQWYPSLAFTGGPWLQAGLGAYSGLATMARAATGNISDTQMNDAQRIAGQAGSTMLQMLNPLSGAMRTVGGVSGALDAPGRADAFGDLITTGGHNATGRQWSNIIGASADRTLQQQAQPLPPGPVRAGGFGQPMPQVQLQSSIGVDPNQVYMKNGYRVADMPDSINGMVPTHRVDQPSGRLPNESWSDYEARVIQRTSWGPDTAKVSDIGALDPGTRNKVLALQGAASAAGINLTVGETARTQARQEMLFQQGRNGSGTPVTWTLTSDHANGRAVDFIVNGDTTGKDPGYRWLQQQAQAMGLSVMGAVDPGHVANVQGQSYGSQGSQRPGGGAQF